MDLRGRGVLGPLLPEDRATAGADPAARNAARLLRPHPTRRLRAVRAGRGSVGWTLPSPGIARRSRAVWVWIILIAIIVVIAIALVASYNRFVSQRNLIRD